jgi:hypothetical protein
MKDIKRKEGSIMSKVELKRNINKLCDNHNPKKIDLLYWLDLELDKPQLEIQMEVHNTCGDSQYYCLEVLETGEYAEEFRNYDDLTKKHIDKYKNWSNWLGNIYSATCLEEVKEVVHI